MGGDFRGVGVGGMGGGSSNVGHRRQSIDLMADTPPPGGVPNREYLRAQKEAAKQAAMAEKVDRLRAANEQEEADRDHEQVLEKTIRARVAAWQQEKKNLRALLASLHEIAPPCSWKPKTLAELVDPAAVKKAYHRACIAIHPDKQPTGDVEKKVLAQHVFDTLRSSWQRFEQGGV